MTTKVVDFLNESGGSNFTETATRPPPCGEENELQSNGGNSTKSSSSHRSHVSSKSHSSSRSGTSGKGDHSHSPATTPRKSNKTPDTMTGHHASLKDGEEDSEVAAPLGFEPEGSAANSPPYSENGTPPHLKWAENLNYLLGDSDGVAVFQDFMEHELEGGSEELQFWFACQGLKRKIGSNSLDSNVIDIQKAIYKRYVRTDKVKCISKDIKKEIAEKLSNKSALDKNIFDAAQKEVETSMRNVTYPAFLRSDYYVQYVQNYGDSPKSSQSSGSNSARPVSQSGLLPVLHEDKELESNDLETSLSTMPPPVISKAPSSCRRQDSALPTKRNETISGSLLYNTRQTSSPYPVHVSYAPVSAQDSELQSLSSEALTDDTISVTDSSLSDGYSHHLRNKHRRKTMMKNLAQHNREFRTGLHSQIIPRTEHAPKDRNIAEINPRRFADLLIDKLNKVVEERENSAKVEEKLRSLSEVDKSEGEEKLVTSFSKPSTSAAIIPLMRPSAMVEETPEDILNQHLSRIWASSDHQTPSYSPQGRQSPPPHTNKSPDRHKDGPPRKKQPSQSTSLSASGAYPVRGFHKKREFVSSSMSYDSGIEDRNMLLCGTETHRHIHHHHHHHHSSRDSSQKKTMVEMEVSSPWRSSENPHNLSADFISGDPGARGRTSARKGAPRKFSATSSNMDSGISVMYDKDSARVPPLNWNNPASEKVIKWIMDSETVQEASSSAQDGDRSSSSHKRSHRLNQSTGSSQPPRQSSKSKASTRSTSMERSGLAALSPWSGAPGPVGASILPSQPFAQDSSMPLLDPPNPTTQLEEAKRRLETQSRASASPVKSKSFTGVPSKDKTRPPVGGGPPMPPPHTRTLPSARTVPTDLDTSGASHSLDSRFGGRPPLPTGSAPTSYQTGPTETIIGIYMGQEPIPYRHQLPGRAITLAQIKNLVTKRGPFKYFFKRHSDEFDDNAGAVFEEISNDNAIVPMWQGKIVVKVDKMES